MDWRNKITDCGIEQWVLTLHPLEPLLGCSEFRELEEASIMFAPP